MGSCKVGFPFNLNHITSPFSYNLHPTTFLQPSPNNQSVFLQPSSYNIKIVAAGVFLLRSQRENKKGILQGYTTGCWRNELLQQPIIDEF